MALVLKARKRRGQLKRFDVVRVGNSQPHTILNGIKTGEYHIHTDEGKVEVWRTHYRTVQEKAKVSG